MYDSTVSQEFYSRNRSRNLVFKWAGEIIIFLGQVCTMLDEQKNKIINKSVTDLVVVYKT